MNQKVTYSPVGSADNLRSCEPLAKMSLGQSHATVGITYCRMWGSWRDTEITVVRKHGLKPEKYVLGNTKSRTIWYLSDSEKPLIYEIRRWLQIHILNQS